MKQEIPKKETPRDKQIIQAGIVGIITNVILAAFKAVIGLAAHSIAIILDALNNLSDALSSIITIVGMKLATKPADKNHPMGYGRIEYMSSFIVAGIVTFAGGTSLIESIKKIITPVETHYSALTFIIVAVAIVVKIILGLYTSKVGNRINSGSLKASGADAMFDAIVSFSTIVGATITVIWGLSIDGWIGSIIAIVMIKAGIDMASDTLNNAIGERPNPELTQKIKDSIKTIDHVYGAYDLIINSYGPENKIGSVDIEVSDQLTPMQIYRSTLLVKDKMLKEFGIFMAVGIYIKNSTPGPELDFETKVKDLINEDSRVISVHGFYVDFARKVATMDVVKSFKITDNLQFKEDIDTKLKKMYPDYAFNVWIDTDFSD